MGKTVELKKRGRCKVHLPFVLTKENKLTIMCILYEERNGYLVLLSRMSVIHDNAFLGSQCLC